MATKFPNSGRLNYSQRKVHPKSPDLYGELVLDRHFLKDLMEQTDEDDIVIKLDGWQQDGNYGPWFSIKVNTYKKPDGSSSTSAPARAAPPPANDEDIPF